MTHEEKLQAEIAKNPVATIGSKAWRMQNLYFIRTKDQRRVPLTFNPVQQRLSALIAKDPGARPFVLKARQMGISTFFLIEHLDSAIFESNCLVGILSHSKESLSYLVEIIRLAIDTMPKFVRPRLDEQNKTAISFLDSRSRIFVSLSIRSTAVHRLHLSEYCFCDPAEIEASLAAAGPASIVTAESTPNGLNHGYDAWLEAKAGTSSLRPLFFPWYLDPTYATPLLGIKIERTEEEGCLADRALKDFGLILSDEQILFRRGKKKELKRFFGQEFVEDDEACFLSSGGTRFFDAAKVNRLLQEARQSPATQGEGWDQWEQPHPGHVYACGADSAEGGGDYSVLAILCVTCRRQAFRFRARVGVDTFYRVCDRWGRAYNNALLGVERNNHGHAVILGLNENCRYPNLYRDDVKTRIVGSASGTLGKIGWDTNSTTRAVMLDNLALAMLGDSEDDEDHFAPEYTVCDTELLREALAFEEKDGKFQAAPGRHDDLVMAWAIATQMYFKLKRWGAGFDQSKIFIGEQRLNGAW